jgi:hypothetical protein
MPVDEDVVDPLGSGGELVFPVGVVAGTTGRHLDLVALSAAVGQDLDALRIGDDVSVGQKKSTIKDDSRAGPLLWSFLGPRAV